MAISRREAKPLCTAAEFAFAEESFPPHVREFSIKEIRSRITRARRLRDKYVDLAKKQGREILGKAPPTRRRQPTGKAGTVTKRDFFVETLKRFEDRLGVLERQEAREEAKVAKEKADAALAEALERKKESGSTAPKATKKARKGMKSVPSRKREQFPNLQTMKGAARANQARAQARRDNRGSEN